MDYSGIPATILETTTFFNRIISRRKTPASRNQARKMKLQALEGICSFSCCEFSAVTDEQKRTTSAMEAI